MTSYAATSSTVLPGAVPVSATAPATSKQPAHAAPGGLLRLGTGTRAMRFGLGVAVAGLLAGDVYAILRSPVSEGGSSRAATSAAQAVSDRAGRAGGATSWSGTPAMPFSETAYAASLSPRPSLAAKTAGSVAAPAVTAPALVVPALPLPSAFTPVDVPALTNPAPASRPATDPGGSTTDTPAEPAASPLAPVLAVVAENVPVVGEPVAEAVEQVTTPVVEALPAEETTTASETVSEPASTGGGLLP